VRLATELTHFLTQAQRSLPVAPLQRSRRQREAVAQIEVEFAEDRYQDMGLGRSLEPYNREFFGTPLPCLLPPDHTLDPEPVTPVRVQYLLWTLYSELDPALTLAPQHQDLAYLATGIAAFLGERFAHLQIDSGVKTFLALPNTYGWEVKQKLVWLGQHSYLFRLNFANYVHAHGESPTFPPLMISCVRQPPAGRAWAPLICWPPS
jgi:hypothetical protein